MKRGFFFVFLFFYAFGLASFVRPSRTYFSTDVFIVSPGEYVPMGLDVTTGVPYSIGNVVPSTIAGAPSNVTQAIGGPHSACVITAAGAMSCYGQNASGAVPNGTTTDQSSLVAISIDSVGNALDPFAQVVLSGNNYGAFWSGAGCTTTGKAYVWGETEGGNLGNGTWGCAASTRPVQVSFSGGAFITKMQLGLMVMTLDSAGQVWTWGGGGYNYILGRGNSPAYMTPGKVTLPGGRRAVDIAGGGNFSYILLDNGDWLAAANQNYPDYIGIYPSGTVTTSFQNITSFLSPYFVAGSKASKIWINSESTYAILNTGGLYSWGGSATGTTGTGAVIDYSRYGCCPTPYGTNTFYGYSFDGGPHELQVFNPTAVAPGKNDFKNVYVGYSNSFYTYFTDNHDQLYACGRNKSAAIANGIIGANPANGGISASYPDSWEVPYITPVDPLSLVSAIQSTSPYCILNPSGAPCNTYSIPANTKPVPRMTIKTVGSTVIVDASASSDNVWIAYYFVKRTSGPGTFKTRLQTAKIDTFYNVPTGLHTFQLNVTDNGWLADSISATVMVGSYLSIPQGSKIIIH